MMSQVSTATTRLVAQDEPNKPLDQNQPLKFTKSQFDVLLEKAPIIEDTCYGQSAEAWEAFAKHRGTHTAAQWENFFKTEVRPVYIERERQRKAGKSAKDDRAALINSRKTPPAIVLKNTSTTPVVKDIAQSSSKRLVACDTTTGITSPSTDSAQSPRIRHHSQDSRPASMSYYSSPKYSDPVVLISSPYRDRQSLSNGIAPPRVRAATPSNPPNLHVTEEVSADASRLPADLVYPDRRSEDRAFPKRKRDSDGDRLSGSPELSEHLSKRQRQQSPSLQPPEIAETPEEQSASSSTCSATNLLRSYSQTTVEIVDVVEAGEGTQSNEWNDIDDEDEVQLNDSTDIGNGTNAHTEREDRPETVLNCRTAAKNELEMDDSRIITAEDDKFGIYEDAEFEPSEDEQENILLEGQGPQINSNTHSVDALKAFSSNPVDFQLVPLEECWSDSSGGEANDHDQTLTKVPCGMHQATDDDEGMYDETVETPQEPSEELRIKAFGEFDTQIPDFSMPLPPDESDEDNENEGNVAADETMQLRCDDRQQQVDAQNALHSDPQMVERAMACPSYRELDDDGDVDFDNINPLYPELINKQRILNPPSHVPNLDMPTLSDETAGEGDSHGDSSAEINIISAQYQEFRKKQRTFQPTNDLPAPSDNNAEEGETKQSRRTFIQNLDTQAILASDTQNPDLTIPSPHEEINDNDDYHPYEFHSSPPTIPSTARKLPSKAFSLSPNSSVKEPAEPSDPRDAIDNFITRSTMLGHSLANVFEAIERTTLNTGRAQLVLEALSKGEGVPKDVRGVWTKEMDEVLMECDAGAMVKLEQWHGKEEYMARLRFLEEMM